MRKGYVYFLRAEDCTGPVKIGFSASPERRLRHAMNWSPVKLQVLHKVEAPAWMEGALHSQFSDYRLHGEWFQATPRLLALIHKIQSGGNLSEFFGKSLEEPAHYNTPATRVIETCGGHQAVAEMLGVDVSRVYRWTYPRSRGGSDGVIPARHQARLLSEASKRGLPLRPDDFFPKRGEAA